MDSRGSQEVFVKNDSRTLESIEPDLSISQRHSLTEIQKHYDSIISEKYCMRQVMDAVYILKQDVGTGC